MDIKEDEGEREEGRRGKKWGRSGVGEEKKCFLSLLLARKLFQELRHL